MKSEGMTQFIPLGNVKVLEKGAGLNAEDREKGIPHECGVAGVYYPGGDVAGALEYLLFGVNHRGQEGAGVLVAGEKGHFYHKGAGLVKDVITAAVLKKMRAVKGRIAIGQARYSTAGKPDAWQPFYDENAQFALVHNGNFTNVDRMLTLAGKTREETLSDSWVAHQAILAAEGNDWEDKIANAVSHFDGAYSLVMQSDKKLFAVRDPRGMRPLCLGMLPDGGYVVASEPNAFTTMGAVFLQDIRPGQGIVIDEDGVREFYQDPRTEHLQQAFCSFEYFYLAKPNSVIEGRHVGTIRRRLGMKLAQKDKAAGMDLSNAVVVGVQDSGVPYAQAYAHESGVELVTGLVKNVYQANGKRAFMQPNGREQLTQNKHEVDPFFIEGKDIVLVDDSLVRGITMLKLLRALIEQGKITYGLKGPRSIHVRIAAPRIMNPCFWGVDFSTRAELANDADALDPVEAIRRMIGADSLVFATPHEAVEAIIGAPVDPHLSVEEVFAHHGLCGHCFGGKAPTEVRREGLSKKSDRR